MDEDQDPRKDQASGTKDQGSVSWKLGFK
jgi:hypothetical protein